MEVRKKLSHLAERGDDYADRLDQSSSLRLLTSKWHCPQLSDTSVASVGQAAEAGLTTHHPTRPSTQISLD